MYSTAGSSVLAIDPLKIELVGVKEATWQCCWTLSFKFYYATGTIRTILVQYGMLVNVRTSTWYRAVG